MTILSEYEESEGTLVNQLQTVPTQIDEELQEANIIPYKPRWWQWEAHNSLKKFNVLVCHRRSGKTEFAVNELQKRAMMCPNTHYAYIAPTSDQVRSIAWDRLKNYARHVYGVTTNETFMIVRYPNGSTIRLFGAHEPDRLRGQGFHGVVLDETQDLPRILWDEILLPTLAGKPNWFVIILGTPKGRNLFYELYERGLKKKKTWFVKVLTVADTRYDQTTDFKLLSSNMSEDRRNQEWYCDFYSNSSGVYYAKYMAAARAEGRINREVKWNKTLPVFTSWDIGLNDKTVIWFFQRNNGKIYFIDYMASTDVSLEDWIKQVKAKPYKYQAHYAPHDMAHRDYSTGVTRADFAARKGLGFTITMKTDVADGIEAARLMLPRCEFAEVPCKEGILALENYRSKFDKRSGMIIDEPLHDWASDPADSFRYAAVNVVSVPNLTSQSAIHKR